MKKTVTLADTEWRLMQIIWDKHPITFREICDMACPAYGWTRHAVISYLKRMEAKGAIAVEDAKPVKLYTPLIDRENTIQAETEAVMARVYNGDPFLMAQAMARQQGLSEVELAQLMALLRKGDDGHA